jgi:hypothetical protein
MLREAFPRTQPSFQPGKVSTLIICLFWKPAFPTLTIIYNYVLGDYLIHVVSLSRREVSESLAGLLEILLNSKFLELDIVTDPSGKRLLIHPWLRCVTEYDIKWQRWQMEEKSQQESTISSRII